MAECHYISMHIQHLTLHADNELRRVVTFTLRPFASWKTAHSGLWLGDSDGNRFRLDSVESKQFEILSSRVTVHRPSTSFVYTIHIVPILKHFNAVEAHSLFVLFLKVYVYISKSFSGPRKFALISGAFTKLRKATISFVTSVCLSVSLSLSVCKSVCLSVYLSLCL
jgi:hypothetical protein